MPFAGYEDFESCVKEVMRKKGLSKERAQKYCGKIKHQVEKDWQFDMDISKVAENDDGELYICGYASNGDEDHDGERMDMDSLKAAFDEYMKNPVIKFMHDKAPQWRGAVGKVVPEYTDSNGEKWVTKFDDKPFLVIKISKNKKLDWLRDMVEDGDIKGLSIGGKASQKDNGLIKIKSWLETSLVDVPSAKGSFFKVLKQACIGDECMIEKETETETKPSQAEINCVREYLKDNPDAELQSIADNCDIEPERADEIINSMNEETEEKKGNCDAIKTLAFININKDATKEDIAEKFNWNVDYVDNVINFINKQVDDDIHIESKTDRQMNKLMSAIDKIGNKAQ